MVTLLIIPSAAPSASLSHRVVVVHFFARNHYTSFDQFGPVRSGPVRSLLRNWKQTVGQPQFVVDSALPLSHSFGALLVFNLSDQLYLETIYQNGKAHEKGWNHWKVRNSVWFHAP